MSFWSSQTLERRIAELVDDPHSASVDCNALQLRVGREIYVTPNVAEINNHTKQQLSEGEAFLIPPGQFAFLLTEETVSVPPDAMAFISMKATFKMKGLVNVSGFHVDPGWTGRLIFAIFNAGPQPVHLQRGLPLFLIWYAGLDAISEKRKTGTSLLSIPPATINNLTGGSDSFFELSKKLESEVKRLESDNHALSERMHKLNLNFWRAAMATAALAGVLGTIAFRPIASSWWQAASPVERGSPASSASSAAQPSVRPPSAGSKP